MKKFLAFIILSNLFFSPVFAAADSNLPDLPVLPSLEIYTDSVEDVFSPSTTPSQIAPKNTVQPKPTQTNTQKTTTTNTKNTTQTQTAQKNTVKKVTKQNTEVKKTTNNSYYQNNKNSYVIPKGKKFQVVLAQAISSSTPEGTRISFKSTYPETSRYITIPAGTIFYGRITDTHGPQITGNGGLIVIEVNQMVYQGKTYNIDAKISVANEKRIFLNNIKGKRMYFQSIPKALKPGTTFFKKMWRVTCKLAQNESGVEIILTPFSLITGVVVYAVNLVASPVVAIFYKGKSITIPANSRFIIQLREDAVLYK